MIPLHTIALLFLRLGVTAFGGPAAHIAMLHHDVVRRRRWISDAEFADLLAVTNLLPGPNSTEMVIHVGRRVAGWRGFIVAGLCFILPAALMVAALGAMYVRYGRTPDARAAMSGIAPVVLAIIVHAVVHVGRATLRDPGAWIIALTTTALSLARVNELILLAAAGLVSLPFARTLAGCVALAPGSVVWAQAAHPAHAEITLASLTLFFLKVGSILFGSGYVLVAYLRADLVDRWHWLTDQQLIDAIAVGQTTPGPVLTTATFIGYVLAGWPGAVLATVAIFIPAFVFVALTQPLLPVLRDSPLAGAFLKGVVAASIGLIAAVAASLAMATLTSAVAGVAAVVALTVLLRWNVNSAWLVLAGGFAGWVAYAGMNQWSGGTP